jgi:23S rRNA (uracil1939-C5)-methyltransferase
MRRHPSAGNGLRLGLETCPVPPKAARIPASETIVLTIEAVGGRGDGLARWQGEPVYVPATAPGDRVRVRLEPPRGEGRRGRVLERLATGPETVAPPCQHFGRCGGCTLQHLAEPAYRRWKLDQVRLALSRAGLPAPEPLTLAATPPGGRRRAAFAVTVAGGRVLAGFAERLSHRLVDLETCPVLAPELMALLPVLRRHLPPVLGERGNLDAVACQLEGGLDLLLVGPPVLTLAAREALAALAEEADLARLSWQPKPGARPEPLAARRPAAIRFGPALVEPPPGTFLQPAREGEAALVQAVLEGVALAQGGATAPVADLFAGCGTFSFPLAAGGRPVHAVDGDEAALAALSRAARPHLTGTPLKLTSQRRDLFTDPLTPAELAGFAAVVLDPPRAGAAAQAAALAASGVPVVVAVSCNPATFARDARTLAAGGYVLERLSVVDQFLWSAHVELVAVFRTDRASRPGPRGA